MPTAQSTFTNLAPDKQNRVLETATQEFAEHGFHQASVNRMVSALGIAKGSLFKYFGNKQGLFEYIFTHNLSLFKNRLREIRDMDTSTDFFDRVTMTMQAETEFIASYPLVYRIYLKMVYQENFPCRDRFMKEIRSASARYWRKLVQDGMDGGSLRNDTDVDTLAFYLDAVTDRFLQSLAVPGLDQTLKLDRAEGNDLNAKIQNVTNLIRDGLAAR